MSQAPRKEMAWSAIEVDGEPFEWCVVDVEDTGYDGRAPDVPLRRVVRILAMRRPGSELHMFGITYASGTAIDESAVPDAIRRSREGTPLALDYRRDELTHARALAAYWGRLPLAAQRELARTWLERCERRCGHLPAIDDVDDLREVCTKTLLAARGLGLAEGDDEEAAQTREVHAAFEKHVSAVRR